jgi:hypothetical protein
MPFARVFLLCFLVDGIALVGDAAARLLFETALLDDFRLTLAWAVVASAVPVILALALGPRLPRAILLPPLLFLVWSGLGAFPIGLWIETATFRIGLVAVAQSLLGLRALRQLAQHVPSRAPLFQLGHALRAAALAALVGLGGWLEQATARFVTFDAVGVQSGNREYRRGDRSVHLVGMMHIGEGDAYRELFESFAGRETVVLEEGVTDEQGLLGGGRFYDQVAGGIGLDVQPSFEVVASESPESPSGEPWPDVIRADVDAADFSPETIEFLGTVAKIYQSPDLATAIERFNTSLGDVPPETTQIVVNDIIELRNTRLIDELLAALDSYERIVVPWGALHLPVIERVLVDEGFELHASSERRLVRYGTIIRALWSPPDRADPLQETP